jgi:hypothetical protein
MNHLTKPNLSGSETLTAQAPSLGETHEVFNQPTSLDPFNAYYSDASLQHWVNTFQGNDHQAALSEYGQRVGGDLFEAGFAANKYKPEFKPHSRFGERIDQVDFHPAYHLLMETAIEAGHHSLPCCPSGHRVHAQPSGPRFWLSTYDDVCLCASHCPSTKHSQRLVA